MDAIEQTATGTGLSYSGDGTWLYNWKTTGVAVGCRTMTLKLLGGMTQTVSFEFR